MRGPQITQQKRCGLPGDPLRQGRSGRPPQMQIHPQQLGVVVEHLLEVRDGPGGVHAVAGEAARKLVVDPAASHPLARGHDHTQTRAVPGARRVPQQHLQQRGRRKLRCRPETAVGLVERAPGLFDRGRQELGRERRRRPACGVGRCGDLAHDVRAGRGHLVPARPPGACHRLQQLAERSHPRSRRRREVGTGVKRLARRGEEDGHRPTAVAGEGDGDVHVDGVDIRPLLAVNLDVDKVLVHDRRGGGILERLVRHDMTPVARRVSHGQQDRYTTLGGLGERVRAPRPPVDRVVRVLEQVR